MSESSSEDTPMIVVKSARFGDISVAADTVIEFPGGMIGFPRHKKYVMFDHKPPFAWLHSTEDPNLAFVVIDGSQFTDKFEFRAPFGDKEIDLKEEDEYAILVVVTVRSDPKTTTANLKAPLFVNIKNRRGIQIIYDDAKYPTRFHLWSEKDEEAAQKAAAEAEKK